MEQATISYREMYKEQLNQDGVVVIEDNVLTESDSFVTSCLMIALHRQGELHVRYDLKDKVFSNRKVVILLPQHMISNYWATKDFQRTLILVSPEISEELKHTVSYRNHLLYHNEPECELTEQQWNNLMPSIDFLHTIIQSSSHNKKQMLVHFLDIILELVNTYNIENQNKMFSDDSNRLLFTQFYELLIEHYRESRDIKYYADRLCLTPKYFAKLIKQSTSITASDWIDNYVVMQAKTYLKGYPQLSIQQISNQLGFNEQSIFCRYFKTHVGISPRDFRKTEQINP